MRVIHEDDNIPRIVRSFFLSFFRVFTNFDRRKGFPRRGSKIGDEKRKRVRRRAVRCARLSLSLLVSFVVENGKANSIVSLVLANVAPRHARVVPDTRFFRTHTTCVLKYFLIEHNILNRNARSVGRGDETHHETDQRNEPV